MSVLREVACDAARTPRAPAGGPRRALADAAAIRGGRRRLPGRRCARSPACRSPRRKLGEALAALGRGGAGRPTQGVRGLVRAGCLCPGAKSPLRSITCARGGKTRRYARCRHRAAARPRQRRCAAYARPGVPGRRTETVRHRSSCCAGLTSVAARARCGVGAALERCRKAQSASRRRLPALSAPWRARARERRGLVGTSTGMSAQIRGHAPEHRRLRPVHRAGPRAFRNPRELCARAEVVIGQQREALARAPRRHRAEAEFGEVYWSMANLLSFAGPRAEWCSWRCPIAGRHRGQDARRARRRPVLSSRPPSANDGVGATPGQSACSSPICPPTLVAAVTRLLARPGLQRERARRERAAASPRSATRSGGQRRERSSASTRRLRAARYTLPGDQPADHAPGRRRTPIEEYQRAVHAPAGPEPEPQTPETGADSRIAPPPAQPPGAPCAAWPADMPAGRSQEEAVDTAGRWTCAITRCAAYSTLGPARKASSAGAVRALMVAAR